jgi:uncharacterized protein (DUF1800 family)
MFARRMARAAGCMLAGLLLAPGAWAEAAPALNAADARHLLTRTGFAPDEREVAAYVGLSRERAVDALLAGTHRQPRTPPPPFVNEAIVPFRSLASDEARKAERERQVRNGLELRAWWLREMLETDSPLTERMTLFWHNHFATSQQKVRYAQPMYRQNLLLRQHALGNFRDMLHAVAKDPAMLVYLDGATSRKEAPNENFAREVMELFTLGEATEGGHYTEADIRNAARAFTGWSIERDDFSFVWRPRMHDDGVKTIFGRSGNFDGDQALELILARPEVASFISGKLWREFVSPEPQPQELQRVAEAFRASGYDIKSALRALLLTPSFWSEANRGALVKSPVDLVVGTMRQFGFGYSDTLPLALRTAGMGQNLFSPPNVKGWPGGTAWIDSNTLLDRKRFLEQLFRAIEMPPATAMMPVRAALDDLRQGQKFKGLGALGREGVLRVAQAQASIWFDADAWLRQYGGYLDREPNVSTRLAVQKALLPLEPVNPTPAGTVGLAYLRNLVMDPVYQLK